MASFLDRLLQYHQLTVRLFQLNQQVEGQRRRSRVQERKVQEHLKEVGQLHERIRKAQAAAGEADLDLKTRDATLDKLRSQLNTAKTNKEYSTLLREINTFKADTGRIEEQALSRMTEVDQLKAQQAAMHTQVEQEQRRLAELQGEAQARQQELADQVARVTEERKAAEADVPADVLAQINRVAEAHEGEAMAPIVRAHPKREEYICGGCNMGVTLEQVNSLQSRDEIQVCNCCGRLLYLGETALPSRS